MLSSKQKNQISNLSDKDLQLIKKNYSKLTQIYYQNKQNKDSIKDILQLSKIITQVISSKQQSQALSLISTMQILKVKSKSCQDLIKMTDMTIDHLRSPKVNNVEYQGLIYCLKRSQLFVVGCTIGIRFFQKINNSSKEFDWKQIINQMSRNISISPILCIEYISLICKNNQIYSKIAVKSGLVKYIFLSYISNSINDKFNLYKAIKLLKIIANVEKKLINDKQKSLALIIYKYSNYIPVIQQICSKCYDQEYGQSIDNKRRYDINSIDQPYLWSYNQYFCMKNLTTNTIIELFKTMEKDNGEETENKIYAILNNFSRFRPNQFQELLSKCKNAKILQRFKHLDDSKNKDQKIGKLDQNIKRKFDVQKDAGYMMERVCKIPKSNDQLGDIIQVLKEKDRINQFQSDTLRNVKQRALNSLKTSIIQRNKLNLNIILKEVQLNDVQLIAELLQILQLNITMNEDLIDNINVDRVMQIIKWIQDNYKGQMIEWGSIGQLINILNEQNQWKSHLNQLPQKAHWILGVQLSQDNKQKQQKLIIQKISSISKSNQLKKQKIPLFIGFLGRILSQKQKINFYKNNKGFFQLIFNNIKNNNDYKLNLLMMSYYIKNWSEDAQSKSQQNDKYFKEIIQTIIHSILNNFRNNEQEYQFLQRALPYQFVVDNIDQNIDYVINKFGKLASYIYKQNPAKNKSAISYNKIKKISNFSSQHSEGILQTLIFLEQNSELLHQDQISKLIDSLTTKKLVYWSLYPNFAKLMLSVLQIIKKTNNLIIKDNISIILSKLINLLNNNKDISSQQKQEFFYDILDTLQQLQKRGIYLDKEKLFKNCQKITLSIKEQLIQFLNNYKITIKQGKKQIKKQENPIKNNEQSKNIPQNINNVQKSQFNDQTIDKKIVEQVAQDNLSQQSQLESDKQDKKGDNVSYQQQLQVLSNKKNNNSQQIDVLQALRQLKKIIEKELPQERYHALHQVFLNNLLKQELKDILGHLLAKFYHNRPQNIKKMVLQLLKMKDKTSLSQDTCYQLLKKYSQTFCLSKRWKLKGRQWHILAMERFNEGYYGDASQVIQYNIFNQAQLQYFYDKKFYEVVKKNFDKVLISQGYAYYLVLIGTSATKMKQIKEYYTKQKIYMQILNSYTSVISSNMKVISNMSYALSSFAFSQTEVCVQIAKQQKVMNELFLNYKINAANKVVIQSACSLIANLAYSNDQVKQLLTKSKISQILMIMLQVNIQVNPNISTFKQILRAMGNLSILPKFTAQIIDSKFCALLVKIVEKLNIFINFDDKKANLMKIMIDLLSNMTSHRYKLQVCHSQKLTQMVFQLLQNSQTYPAILSICIDTIDCLCQNQGIQNYIVSQKKIPYLLIDILKIHTDQKIIVKSTRLLTNLTINQFCVPYILQANLLSVLANIVMPHFYGNKLVSQQKKKMQTYILKIIIRISNSKQSKQLILKSGYLDCLIITIQTAQVIQQIYMQLFFQYLSSMPSFLSRRAFYCLLRIIMKKNNYEIIAKCFKALNSFSNKFQDQQINQSTQGMIAMYQKQFQRDMKQDFLALMGYHLLRSHRFRYLLSKKTQQLFQAIKKMSLDTKYMDICKQILFLIFNPRQNILQLTQYHQDFITSFQMLKKGFKCNLFRIDGSSKSAMIDITDQFKIRAYKFPNGQIKDKYVFNLRNLKQFNFNYNVNDQVWIESVYTSVKGIFDFSKIDPALCITLLGLQKWREINFINVSFENSQDKLNFIKCICSIYKNIE